MNRIVLPFTLGFVFLSTCSLFAQTPKPKPTPPDEDVVKISTNLIQVDVTVTDKNGNPIRDLKPGEIEIYENGKQQNISGFSFVPGTRLPAKNASEIKADKKNANNQVNLPAAPIRPEEVRRTIALVVDDITLSFGSTVWVKAALKKFVNEQMQDGDLVAIVRSGAGIGALQQFTNDKRRLLAAIEQVKFNMSGSAKIGLFDPIDPSGLDARAKERENFSTNIYAYGTLGALNFVVRGMKDLPGRKSIFLMSDGLSLIFRDESGKPHQSEILDPLKRLIDLANRNSVVFYTIDAGGLVVPMAGAEDDIQGVRENPQAVSQVVNRRSDQMGDGESGLRLLSDETGGVAFMNQNNLSTGIQKMLDDQSYYLVAYVPNDETFDLKKARYNQIEVKVSRPDVKVRYRSGFFSVASEKITDRRDPTAVIVDAITSPFTANGITVRMNALFVSDARRGMNLRTFINIDSKDITFKKTSDGRYKATFDVFAMTYGDNGQIQDQRYNRATVLANQQEYELIQKRGLVSDFVVGVKKPGGYQLRVAIRDNDNNLVGSANQFVVVPDLGKKELSVSGAVLTSEPVKKAREAAKGSQPIIDSKVETTVKQFHTGTILRYDYFVYNAKSTQSQKADLSYKLRLYRDGKVVFEGDDMPLPVQETDLAGTLSATGVLQLGDELVPGDYIMQAEITDLSAGRKKNKVNQFVQFEIIR
ncbi:hypothetical protein BH10ACI2_BH10ACI2_07900 [soil metagenome]